MENENIGYDEAKENLNTYNLKELHEEALRFGLSDFDKLSKEELIEKILEQTNFDKMK